MAKKKSQPAIQEDRKLEPYVEKIAKDKFSNDFYIDGVYDENHPLNVALQNYIRENKLPAYNLFKNVAEVEDGFLAASFK